MELESEARLLVRNQVPRVRGGGAPIRLDADDVRSRFGDRFYERYGGHFPLRPNSPLSVESVRSRAKN